jgi:hypothetical protein
MTIIKISSIKILAGTHYPSAWMGPFFSGASLSGGSSGRFRSGSTSGTGGTISGSCFLGSPFIASPPLFRHKTIVRQGKTFPGIASRSPFHVSTSAPGDSFGRFGRHHNSRTNCPKRPVVCSDSQTDGLPHATIHMFGRLKGRFFCFLLLISKREKRRVIALRMLHMAAGDARAQAEVSRMVTEKTLAACEAQAAAGGRRHAGPQKAWRCRQGTQCLEETRSRQQTAAFAPIAKKGTLIARGGLIAK